MKIQFKSKHKEQEVEMMDAGRYYIGDLCYVIDNAWGEICDLTFPFSGSKGVDYPSWIQSIQLSGKLKLADNRSISIYGTAHGDGRYAIKSPAGNRVGGIVWTAVVLDASRLIASTKICRVMEDINLQHSRTSLS